jgi:hypothetical protein
MSCLFLLQNAPIVALEQRVCRREVASVSHLGEVDQRQGCTFVLSPECLQQRLGLLEVGRVKHLREPAVDRCQEVSGLGTLPLAVPPAAEACRRPSCQPLHVLTMCHIKRRGHTPEDLVDSRAAAVAAAMPRGGDGVPLRTHVLHAAPRASALWSTPTSNGAAGACLRSAGPRSARRGPLLPSLLSRGRRPWWGSLLPCTLGRRTA